MRVCELPACGGTQTPLLRPHLHRFLPETPALGSLKPGFLRAPFPPRGSSPALHTQSSVKASPSQPGALPCSQLDGPPGDRTDPACLCSCSGTNARVKDPSARGMHSHNIPVPCPAAQHVRVGAPSACPARPVSADEDAASLAPTLGTLHPQLFPSAPSHPVSSRAPPTPLC